MMDLGSAMRDPRAAMGVNGDSQVAHVTPGDFVVPRGAMTPALWSQLMTSFDAQGIDPNQYQVGSGRAQTNPFTGNEMFAMTKEVGRSGGLKSDPGRTYNSGYNSTGTATAGNIRDIVSNAPYSSKTGFPLPLAKPVIPAIAGAMTTGAFPLPSRLPANRISADAGNAGAQFTPNGMMTIAGFNYGAKPHYQANSAGEVDSAWNDMMGVSPSRAALALGSSFLGPAGGLLSLAADASGLMPDDWMALDGEPAPFDPNMEPGQIQSSPNGSNGVRASFGAAAPAPAAAAVSAGFRAPSLGTPPLFLGFSPQMSGLQQRSRIATYAANADDGRYRDKATSDYYDKLLANALIQPTGALNPLTSLLPIEQQYLTNVRGLQMPSDTSGLLKLLGFTG